MKRLTIAALAALFALPVAIADEHEEDERWMDDQDAQDCLRLISIDRTEVVDNRNILFFMHDGTVYNNHLPNDCPTLENEDAFMYRTSMNMLCDLDIITVLRDIGFGMGNGPSCGLGKFHPVSQEAAKAMLEGM